MRKDVIKILFIGVEKEHAAFFKEAQEKGVIEFIHPKGLKGSTADEVLQKYLSAIKVLRSLVPVQQVEGLSSDKAFPIAEKILQLHGQILKLQEEMRLLHGEIARIAIFGDFSPTDIAFIEKETGRKFRFFYRIIRPEEDVEPYPEEFISIGIGNGMHYFVTLEKEHPIYEGFIELKIEKPVGKLRERYAHVFEEIHELERELKAMGKYNQFLHAEVGHRLNSVNLKLAEECTERFEEERVFTVQGWVPITKRQQIKELCKDLDVYDEEVEIEKEDVIPTYLENRGLTRIGEDLVHIYDTPSITDHDPSPWVLWAFMFFFAMIINDAGYGLVFLLGALFLYFKFPGWTGVKRRIVKLSVFLSIACIVWGGITTSFFGVIVAPDNPIREISFIDWMVEKKAEYHIHNKDDVYQGIVHEYPQLAEVTNAEAFLSATKPSSANPEELLYPVQDSFERSVLFEFALLVGTVHVILSLLRNIKRSWAGLGWVIFMIGGYLYFPIVVHGTSIIHFTLGVNKEMGALIGEQLLYGGFGLALVLALVQKRLGGSLEFMVLIQIFCDVLSYLRLYALGLAGMMMGTTFNELAEISGPIMGTLIAIAGHTINMAMSIMGGVIHGLRLNFLEWYHYSFEGGGKMFKPLKLIK